MFNYPPFLPFSLPLFPTFYMKFDDVMKDELQVLTGTLAKSLFAVSVLKYKCDACIFSHQDVMHSSRTLWSKIKAGPKALWEMF